jgi:hypothetical protein
MGKYIGFPEQKMSVQRRQRPSNHRSSGIFYERKNRLTVSRSNTAGHRKAEARLAQLARITYQIAWNLRVVEAKFIAIIHGRRTAQREEQKCGHARLLLAEPSGDARPVMVAQNPIWPAAGRNGTFIPPDQRDEIARIQLASIS